MFDATRDDNVFCKLTQSLRRRLTATLTPFANESINIFTLDDSQMRN